MTDLRLPPLTSERTIPLDAPADPDPERTRTIDELLSPVERSDTLVNRSWVLRNDSNELHDVIVDNHAVMVIAQLDDRAQVLTGEGLTRLLTRLADAGLAWVDIAALVGVSVPAVRKWRHGGSASGEKLLELGRLVALIDWLAEEQVIADVAGWLEVPLSVDAPVSRLDLLKTGRRDLVVRSRVGEETRPTDLLDEFDPDWRTRYASDFEVFTAEDGQRSIRSKGSHD